MRKLVAVTVSALLVGTLTAHAGPNDPQAAPTGTIRANPGPLVVARRVEATLVPTPTTCGGPAKVLVTLKNTTQQPWSGAVYLVAGAPTTVPVTLAASGEGASKTVEIAGGVVDCRKALASLTVRIWKNGEEATPILAKALKPKKLSGVQILTAPPAAGQQVWLRRVSLDGACGEAMHPSVTLHAFAAAPQEAKVKLAFGTATKTFSVPVPGNQATLVPLEAPTPVDCGAAASLSSFEYALVSGATASGKLEVSEVTFEAP